MQKTREGSCMLSQTLKVIKRLELTNFDWMNTFFSLIISLIGHYVGIAINMISECIITWLLTITSMI